MRKKKVLKDLSNEIFEGKKEEPSHDIFANKDDLLIEDINTTPKVEEPFNIELGEINDILQNNMNNLNNNQEEIITKEEPKKEIDYKKSLNDLNQEIEIQEAVEELANQIQKDSEKELVMPEINEEIEEPVNKENYEETLNDYSEDLDETEKEILTEEENEITFNDLNERIEEQEENIEIQDNNEEIEKNIEAVEEKEPKIVSIFPKLEKFGTVVPTKKM